MKLLFLYLTFFAILVKPLFAQEQITVDKSTAVKIDAIAGRLDISFDQKIIQEITFDTSEKNAVRFIDFNFDGLTDIQVFRERGTEEYFDIYLFDAKDKKFIKNTKLSELPCPLINKNKKTVIGSCFKASACDRWEEIYKWVANDLHLLEKKGTECNPSNGKSYSYREIYSKDKLIKKTVTSLKSR